MNESSSHYPERYGAWAGNTQGDKPDYERCCASVWSDLRSNQCGRKRGYGPDKAYCKQHDPDAVKARQEKATERYKADLKCKRYEWHGRTFFDALQKIADGHNDPRALAAKVIAEFKAGEIS